MYTCVIHQSEIDRSPLKTMGLPDVRVAELIALDHACQTGVVKRNACVRYRCIKAQGVNYTIAIG